MASVTNTNQHIYVEEQLKAFIRRLPAEIHETALSELVEMVKTTTFKMPRKTQNKKEVAPENLCMARIWAGGAGGQCKKAKNVGSDFCKCCAKKHSACSVPASYNMDGSHKGLFWGRIDEPVPVKASDGKGVAIMWKNEATKEEIREILEDGGAWHPFCTHPPCRTADWDAAPITTMSARKTKKSSKKKSKSKSKRTKNAYLFYMSSQRAQITANLRKFVEETGMNPLLGCSFLLESGNNFDAALATFKKLQKKKKFFSKRLSSLDIEGDGKVSEDFVFKGKYAMGPIGKLGGALWKKMTDADKQPFKDMAAAEKETAEAAPLLEEEDHVDEDNLELEKSDVESGGANSDDDDVEIEDITLDDGSVIMVDEQNVIYSADGEEIGLFNREENTASYYEDDDE